MDLAFGTALGQSGHLLQITTSRGEKQLKASCVRDLSERL
jgi:hypothetical protein